MQLTSWQVSPATADFTKFVDIYLRIHEKSNHFGPFCSLKKQLIVPINAFTFRVNFNPFYHCSCFENWFLLFVWGTIVPINGSGLNGMFLFIGTWNSLFLTISSYLCIYLCFSIVNWLRTLTYSVFLVSLFFVFLSFIQCKSIGNLYYAPNYYYYHYYYYYFYFYF